MEQPFQGDESVRSLKARAGELQAQAAASGSKMTRSAALEAAAQERGFRDWNAASAAGKSAPSRPAYVLDTPAWFLREEPLPSLPPRFLGRHSKFYDSILELIRWAQQLEMIATSVQKDARKKMVNLVGGRVPYVFVQDQGRWDDDVYRLCDRGYDPWPGIAFTRHELAAAAVIEWDDEFGGKGARGSFMVASDDALHTSDELKLRRLARVLASIAMHSDIAFARQLGEMLPKGQGFRIDLKDPEQLSRANVSRLLGCRDDSQHRQLRVSVDGIAYLSDIVGNNDIEGTVFRMETWVQGAGYVGLGASMDETWVDTVLKRLRDNWPNPKATLVDW